MFFSKWQHLEHALVLGVIAYIAVIFLLRISGKRTLSKWNAFDFVVTVAFGSTLAAALTSRQLTVAHAVLAFAMLVVLQYILTWLSVRFDLVTYLIKAEPSLLLFKGNFRDKALKRERVTESEVRAAIRNKGIAAVEDVEAVILETDGSFSVIRKVDAESTSALVDAEGFSSEEAYRALERESAAKQSEA